jgi:hypothetical protein
MLASMTKLTFAVLAILAFAGVARAADVPTYEVTANANLTFNKTSFSGSYAGQTEYSVAGGVSYFWMPEIELGVLTNSSYTAVSNSHVLSVELMVGPTYNFLGKPEDAFFVDGKAGVLLAGNGNFGPNYTLFAYFIGAGKRFELGKQISWKPEVLLTGNSADGSSGALAETQFQVIPFQFSLFF